MKSSRVGLTILLCALGALTAQAFRTPGRPPLPDVDAREAAVKTDVGAEPRKAALGTLRSRLPQIQVDFDRLTGGPALVAVSDSFLTGPQGLGKTLSKDSRAFNAAWVGPAATDPDGPAKAFLGEHAGLFGYGPEILEQARIERQFVTPHNGMRTVVWREQVDGIGVYQGLLIAHTTAAGELVNIGSHFVANPQQAAERGTPKRAELLAAPIISAAEAVVRAGQNVGDKAVLEQVSATKAAEPGPEKAQQFQAAFLRGEAEVKLTWLPLDASNLRLCWQVILTSRDRGEMFLVLVDAANGQVLVRRGLTNHISDATYNVFTSDSPSPFSPGHPNPLTNQPPLRTRSMITLAAANTNASPQGWIPDGSNETLGNNVDAHTDLNDDDIADLPRPQGAPFRVFDFSLDLSQGPSSYREAAVAQLFYVCNWMHDQLYDLGFTEAAGNFQTTNFGRGGLANDALRADAQDGGGTDNANMSTPPDGSAPRMQMYVFDGPVPNRDGDLDTEVVLHEYTHGLSNRRVGGGAGLSASQSRGMGEGWSDFYALALLSEATDDVHACYAKGAYVTYLFEPGFTQNYYFGIRRYPYSTDLLKNPLTFRDIDPTQASAHGGVPRSPFVPTSAAEVHNMGEAWCVMLWEMRANLISKLGFSAGNRLTLQLVTDGMNLAPVDPNFVQARNAIFQAELVNTGGVHRNDLWQAFAKRGLGLSASSPSSSTSTGVGEAYDLPDDFSVLPESVSSSAAVGGAFNPNPIAFTLINSGTNALGWSLLNTSVWLAASPLSGTLPAGSTGSVAITIQSVATNLPLGAWRSQLFFTNLNTGVTQPREVVLNLVGRQMNDDFDPNIDLTQWSLFGGSVGSTVAANSYGGSVSSPNSLWFGDSGSRFARTLPVNTIGGGTVSFWLRFGNSSSPWEYVDLPGEGVVLEVSTNGGALWMPVGTYDTAGFYYWSNVVVALPEQAIAPAALFQWRQLTHSGSSFDHWALDNVSIDAGPSPARILDGPFSQTVLEGGTAGFTVMAAGTPPLQYQWYFNQSPLPGQTSSTLSLANVQFSQAGPYFVVVSNWYGTVTSAVATLTVREMQGMDFQIAGLFTSNSRVVDHDALTSDDRGGIAVSASRLFYSGDGATARFNLDDLSGGASLGRIYDALCSDLLTEQVYSLANGTNLLNNFGGLVTALVALDGGTLQPNGTVVPLSQPISMTFGGIFSGVGRVVLWNGTRVYDILLPSGTVVDLGPLTLPLYMISENWAIWGVAEFWDSAVSLVYVRDSATIVRTRVPDGQTSIVSSFSNLSDMACFTVSLTRSRWYFHHENSSQFGGMYETAGYADAAFLFEPPTNVPPTIWSHPADQTVWLGTSAGFSISASGSAPLAYQWFHDEQPIPFATNRTFTIPAVTLADFGLYSARVTNAFGSALSSNAVLNILTTTNFAVSAADGGWYESSGFHDSFNDNYLVGDSSSTVNNPYRNWFTFDVPFVTAPITEASLRLYSWHVSCPTGSEIYQLHEVLTSPAALAAGGVGKTNIFEDLADGPVFGTRVFTPSDSSQEVVIPLNGQGLAAINAARGGRFAIGGQIASLDAIPYNDEVIFAASTGASSLVALELRISLLSSPVIVSQPADVTTREGSDLQMTVAALGTLPLHYQWSHYGTELPDQTNTALFIPSVTANHSGLYSVVVTNDFGAVTSATATATIYIPTPPIISRQPANVTSPAGSMAEFSVEATGEMPLAYQWLFEGSPLPGATLSSFSMTNIQAAQAGAYRVVLTNIVGAATSQVAILTVTPTLPSITLQPVSQPAFPGYSASFQVAASGTEPFSYQWQFDGIDLPGATSDTLSLTNIQREQAGRYRAVVTNAVGAATSDEALLQLVPVAGWGWDGYGQTQLSLELTNTVYASAGGLHSLILRRDGSVFAWGNSVAAAVPDRVTNVVAVSAGGAHNLALRSDGGVEAWGDNGGGQTNVPAGAQSNVVAVSAGGAHSLALLSNGTVLAWGLNSSGQSSVPFDLTNVVAISAGSNHSLALKANGKVVAWGANNYSQSIVPTNLADVVAISAGGWHNLVLLADGTVRGWGNDSYYQTSGAAVLSNVVAISSGGLHSLVLLNDGSTIAFGAGSRPDWAFFPHHGQSIVPPTVTNLSGVSAGGLHSLALAAEGAPFITEHPVSRYAFSGRRVVLRGAATGALPLSYQWQHEGVDVPGATRQCLVLENARDEDAGNYRLVVRNALGSAETSEGLLRVENREPFVVAQPVGGTTWQGSRLRLQVGVDGSGPFYYQWRLNGVDIAGATNAELELDRLLVSQSGFYSVVVSNAFGMISSLKTFVNVLQVAAWGAGTYLSSSPHYGQSVVPSNLTGVVSLAGGIYHSLARKGDGRVTGWGAGSNYLSSPHYGQSAIPAALTNATMVAGGLFHTLALRPDGTVLAWGAGTNYTSPPHYGQSVVPAGLNNVVAVAAGDYHSVALKADGRVQVWGTYSYNVTNVPSTATNIVAIASRGQHVLALRSDGALIRWGNSSIVPFGISNVVSIAAGVNHCLALRSDGTVYSWGSQTLVPPGLSNIVEVAAGYDFSLALRHDGTVTIWGNTNSYGLGTIPAGLTNVIAIACGAYHNLAALGDGAPLIKVPPVNQSVFWTGTARFEAMAVGAQPMSYRWQHNGVDIPGATNRALVFTNVQPSDVGSYAFIATNVFGAVTSTLASLTVQLPIGQAVDAPQLTWTGGGNQAWFGQTSVTHDGEDAAQSGRILQAQQSWIQTSVTGEGTLSFWWKVSSEEWFDYLQFSLDGVVQNRISGEVDWRQQIVSIPPGTHQLRWTYLKDPSVNSGLDAGWVDQIVYGINPPVITMHPSSQVVPMGSTIVLSGAASGVQPLSYQWRRDGLNIPGATTPSRTIYNGTRRDSGSYSLAVSNVGGVTLSSNAVVIVQVPQRLGNPVRLENGTFLIAASDADGGVLEPADLAGFEAQVSTNLLDWIALPASLSITNGALLLTDPQAAEHPARFYRILEH